MYTVEYFINKFEKIPEDKWGTHELYSGGKSCAYGHCELRTNLMAATKESIALANVLKPLSITTDENVCYFYGLTWIVVQINDGGISKYQQSTPKQRILAALRDIKKMQEPVYTDITKDLAVPPVDKIETDLPIKELIK